MGHVSAKVYSYAESIVKNKDTPVAVITGLPYLRKTRMSLGSGEKPFDLGEL